MKSINQTCSSPRLLSGLATLGMGALLAGCSFLKPAVSTTRHYVLTPAAATPARAAAGGGPAVGLGPVKLPAYLFNSSFAVRNGTNEIDYLPNALWAERLDSGFQRVLGADLATVLPTDNLRLSAWQKDQVSAELYVTLEQFDVDAAGQGVLSGRWRMVGPGGDPVLKSGGIRLTRSGPTPDTDVSGAVATLSELVAEFSRQIAPTLRSAAP
jgi:uncharacterized protein